MPVELPGLVSLPTDVGGGNYTQRTWIVCDHVMHLRCAGPVGRECESLQMRVMKEKVFKHRTPATGRAQTISHTMTCWMDLDCNIVVVHKV